MPVTCQICTRSFKQLTNSHLKVHGLTPAEYQSLHPGCPLVSDEVLAVLRSDRVREIKREAQRKITPEYRHEQGKKVAASWTPERRRASSERMTRLNDQRWADPSYREQQSRQSRQQALLLPFETRSRAMKRLWQNSEYRALISAIRKDTWRTQGYREKVLRGISEYWTAEKREVIAERFRQLWEDPAWRDQKIEALKEMWRDPEFQAAMKPHVGKWTKPEKVVRGWLEDQGLYLTGSPEQVGFVDHVWVKGQFNADFVDFSHKLIIHVDGVYWHHPDTGHPRVIERDRFADAWCIENHWGFIRLTDEQIKNEPEDCKVQIQHLVQG